MTPQDPVTPLDQLARRKPLTSPAPVASRGAAFWAATVFVALVAVLAVMVLVQSDRHSTADRPLSRALSGSTGPTSPSASASPSVWAAAPPAMSSTPLTPSIPSTPSASEPGQCPVTPRTVSQALPTQPPADVAWTVFHGVAEPASREHGPQRKEADVNRCYARTPTGALIAAWQIATRFVLADDWRSVVESQVMPGPGRDAYVAQRRQVRTGTGRDTGGKGQLAAFAIASYTPEVATVQLVSRFAATGHLQVNTVTVVWGGGDWRLQLQPDGSISPSLQAVTSLAGFVPWGGV